MKLNEMCCSPTNGTIYNITNIYLFFIKDFHFLERKEIGFYVGNKVAVGESI